MSAAILATMCKHLPKNETEKSRTKSLRESFEFLVTSVEPFDSAVLKVSFIALNFPMMSVFLEKWLIPGLEL